jgi:hypothetical protein
MPTDDKKPIGAITETVRLRAAQARGEIRRPDTNRPVAEVSPDDEFTDKYELGLITADELHDRRAKRPTDKRLEKLETFKDEVVEHFNQFKTVVNDRIGKVEVAVADFGGQMKMMPTLIETMQNAIEAMTQRETVKFTAEVDVHKAQKISDVEVKTVEAKADAETKIVTAKADGDAKVITAKSRGELITKVVAILGAIGTAIATAIAAGRC